MKRSRLAVALVVGTLVGGLLPGAAMAGSANVDVCHRTGSGAFGLISVAGTAVPAHLQHGDGRVGDPVPAMAGYTFDDTCTPTRAALVRATSTDASGAVRVISELLDTNGDGVPSQGDTARMYEYPTGFDGTDYTDYSVRECLFTYSASDEVPGQYRYAIGGSGSFGCEAYWMYMYDLAYDENSHISYEAFLVHVGDSEAPVYVVELYDTHSPANPYYRGVDYIVTGDGELSRDNSTDDGFLDIQFNFLP